jgi:hypothetical protein
MTYQQDNKAPREQENKRIGEYENKKIRKFENMKTIKCENMRIGKYATNYVREMLVFTMLIMPSPPFMNMRCPSLLSNAN